MYKQTSVATMKISIEGPQNKNQEVDLLDHFSILQNILYPLIKIPVRSSIYKKLKKIDLLN